MDIKYDYRRVGKNIFRIQFTRIPDDGGYGLQINYEIQEPADLPHNLFQRIKQFFTVETYASGTWYALYDDLSLEDKITQTMAHIAIRDVRARNGEKTWEAL